MKLVIMQPYFFPYAGYFDLIHRVDKWVVFDTPQYIRHGWVNRNRILHPQSSWQYIVVPLKRHSRDTPINQIQTASHQDWQGKIIGQLGHYKKKAPFYGETIDLVERALSSKETSLSRLNVSILQTVCQTLEITFNYCYSSEMSLDLGPVDKPGDWALQIAAALKATEYINPPGGAHLFDSQQFEKYDIKLTIQSFTNMVYDTGPYGFEPDLSIIDVLMWNSPGSVKAHLDRQASREG